MIHTLESLVGYLNENVIDENHVLRTNIVTPLNETMEEFTKLKTMLEECIDIGKARQNNYIINPEFSEELKKLNKQSIAVKKQMEELRLEVADDLGTTKEMKFVNQQTYTFVFEVDKKEGDAGMRNSSENYKIVSCKGRVMNFTCARLRELVKQFNTYEE